MGRVEHGLGGYLPRITKDVIMLDDMVAEEMFQVQCTNLYHNRMSGFSKIKPPVGKNL